jgi:hypothetical protein
VHVLQVKCIGEDWIDSGALTHEFFADVVVDIGKKVLPFQQIFTMVAIK